MSSPIKPDDTSKPVLKDKSPHNYRKVGYSMIVISVSLVLIGLLVWTIGSNYHFASNIMASQELDSMTPKSGYDIVYFDYTQPVGGKLKLLGHSDLLDDAHKLKLQYSQQYVGQTGEVLIFDSSSNDNLNIMANAEVRAMTPSSGYNVVLFNTALPVGAKITLGKHDDALVNATKYQQSQKDLIKDPDVQVLIFDSSFDSNLKMVGVSGLPTTSSNNQTIATANPSTNITSQSFTALQKVSINAVASTSKNNTVTLNETAGANVTNPTVSAPKGNIVSLNETVGVNATNPTK